MQPINTRIEELVGLSYGATLIKGILKSEGYKADEIKDASIPTKKAEQLDAYKVMSRIYDMEAEGVSNKDMAEALHQHGLCTLSTGKHLISLLKFCKAYHEVVVNNE